MPLDVFERLKPEKKERILGVLRDEFVERPLEEATVKEIVERLEISRGSFYQYFESLEEAYFFILEREVHSVHELFMDLFRQTGSLSEAIDQYGVALADEVFSDPVRYALYRNRYLSWNVDLEKKWRIYRNQLPTEEGMAGADASTVEESWQFLSAVVHRLMQRLFLEDWSRATFLAHYTMHMEWMKGGLCQ